MASAMMVGVELTSSAQPVLADLRSSGVTGFDVRSRTDEYAGEWGSLMTLVDPSGADTGLNLDVTAHRSAQIATIAGLVQDICIEDFAHSPWPTCPKHPAGGHSLLAQVEDGQAVWTCPSTGEVQARIGDIQIS